MSGKWDDPGSAIGVFGTVFALTALPFGVMMGLIFGDLPTGMVSGFFFGVFMGAAMIPFLRVERKVVTFARRPDFERKLKIEMSELNYIPHVIDPDYIQFRAPNTAIWEWGPMKNMSGESLTRVSVHLEEAGATFIGPRRMVRKVVNRVAGAPPAPPAE